MLKKHIRTHTDVRPYHCNYCNFSFKTKGKRACHDELLFGYSKPLSSSFSAK